MENCTSLNLRSRVISANVKSSSHSTKALNNHIKTKTNTPICEKNKLNSKSIPSVKKNESNKKSAVQESSVSKSKEKEKCNENLEQVINTIKTMNENNEKVYKATWEEIQSKFNDFNNEMLSIKNDMKKILTLNACSVPTSNQKSTTMIKFTPINNGQEDKLQSIMNFIAKVNDKCDWLSLEFCKYAVQQQTKMNDLEENADKFTETVTLLLEAFGLTTSNTNRDNDTNTNNFDSIKNAIECMQQQLNKVEISIMKNEEKTTKMNEQLHILSAKYIQFNGKINKHIFEYNRQKANHINRDEIIDVDVEPFLGTKSSINNTQKQTHVQNNKKSSNQQKSSRKPNIISSGKSSSNRFGAAYMKYEYSKYVKVIIKEAAVYNLNEFVSEVKNEFINTMGKNIVNKVTVSKYKVNNGIICEAEVIISFNIPIGHQYLNDFMYPSNWNFLELMTRRKPQQQRRRQWFVK